MGLASPVPAGICDRRAEEPDQFRPEDCRMTLDNAKGEMIEVSQWVSTSADRIFAVFADGWLYPSGW
jgi:hypothetical protein